MNRRGLARGLRGTAAGSLTTTLALAFHLAGGGAVPSGIAIAGSFGGTIWLSIMIGRRRLSLPLLIAAVSVSQLLLHTVFSVATASGGLQGDGHAGHGSGAPLELALGHAGHAMWWAHVLAGLLTVIGLYRGERVLRRLLELTAIAIRAVLRVVLVVASAPRVAPPLVASRRRSLRPGRRGIVAALRGPPAPLPI